MVIAAIAVVAGLVFTSIPLHKLLLAAGAGYLILSFGLLMLGGMARPLPEPPPPGELRKVKITYRCSLCGTEVRMTVANDEMPDAPRHCMDEMDLVAPIE